MSDALGAGKKKVEEVAPAAQRAAQRIGARPTRKQSRKGAADKTGERRPAARARPVAKKKAGSKKKLGAKRKAPGNKRAKSRRTGRRKR